jgi:hypothetical protein
MTRPVALLACPDSPLAAQLAARLAESGVPAWTLDLDAPLNGEPVTVRDAAVRWQGHDLLTAGALWCEWPVFPWPQPLLPPCELPDAENFARWRHYQREARALAVSALAIAAAAVPTLNPPAAAHLALGPTVALDRLAAAGLPVHPWRVTAAPAEAGEVATDATGADRWHRPIAWPDGAPRLLHAPLAGPAIAVLLVGAEVVAAGGWPAPSAECADAAPAAVALARRAAEALALEIALVAVAADGTAVLRVDAAPDLSKWDETAVAAALARRLAALAARP